MAKGRLLGWFLFLGIILSAWADGGVLPRPTYALPNIPDQQAILWYSNGVEKLVIQTTFTGEGTNFAWIVPLPAIPKIEAVTTGLFPTLRYQFRPELRHHVFVWSVLVLYFGALGIIWRQTKPTGRVTKTDLFLCALASTTPFITDEHIPSSLVGCTILFLANFFVVHRIRAGTTHSRSIIVLQGVLFMLCGLLLPALSKASSVNVGTGVEIHRQETVGSYDTVTLSARQPEELLVWLKTHDFAAPVTLAPVLGDYIRDGWVFVAARLHRNALSQSRLATHPLQFTFPTSKPVYPMRLTALVSRELKVDLFVFGEQRAKAEHFTVRRCARLHHDSEPRQSTPDEEVIVIGHPGLQNLLQGAPVGTWLQGSLAPEQMRQDVWLDWEPFRTHQDVTYSEQGAWLTILNWALLWTIGVFLASRVPWVQRAFRPVRRLTLYGGLILFTLVGTIGFHEAISIVEIRHGPPQSLASHKARYQLPERLSEEFTNSLATNLHFKAELWLAEKLPPTLEKLGLNRAYMFNPYTGLPFREEDSPGNFRIIARTNEFDFFYYDANGFEIKTTYPNPEDR